MKFISVEKDGEKKSKKKVDRTYDVKTSKPPVSTDELSLIFIKASLVSLLIGIIAWSVGQHLEGYTAIVLPAVIWGFLVGFVYGLSYLILPDVHHQKIWSRGTLIGQLWAYKLGLLLLLAGPITLMYYQHNTIVLLTQLGLYLSSLAGLMHVVNMFKSL